MIDIKTFRDEGRDVSRPVNLRTGKLARLMEPLAEALAASRAAGETTFDLAWALLHDPNRVAAVADMMPGEVATVAGELRVRLHLTPLEAAMEDHRLPAEALPVLCRAWMEALPERLAAILARPQTADVRQ